MALRFLMPMKTVRIAVAVLLLAILAVSPTSLESCMAPFLQPVYTTAEEPPDPQQFARGELGILAPRLRWFYLVIAYRYLNGRSLDQQELAALFPKPAPRVTSPPPTPQEEWLQARKRVPGAQPIRYIDVFRQSKAKTYSLFQNCYDDAFESAARKLATLIRDFGPASERVREWLAAQDMVFSNCSQGNAIPQPLPANASPAAREDRSYQIAAAHFYATDYDQARAGFLATGNAYLAARSLIRAQKWAEAEAALNEIVRDPHEKALHESARRLLDYVHTEADPVARLDELGKQAAAPRPKDIRDTLFSYLWLYDIVARRPDGLANAAQRDDLTDWIHAFQSGAKPPGYSRDRWKAKRTAAWLIAALYEARNLQTDDTELLNAADALKPDSPGYISAQYYSVVLLEQRAKNGWARAKLDALLSRQWPLTARNLLLAARMKIATTWGEFLRDAPRQPDGETGADYEEYRPGRAPGKTHDPSAPGLDADGAFILRYQTPLNLLIDAARRPELPASVRRNLAIAAWTRSVLLGRLDTARELTPLVVQLAPELTPDLEAFRTAAPNEAAFAAVFAILRNPGLHPDPEAGYGRLTLMDKINNFRDNWWCSQPAVMPQQMPPPDYFKPAADFSPALRLLYGTRAPDAQFLTAAERRAAATELRDLSATGTAPDYLGAAVLRWAAGYPNDPRVPEALYLVVRATRYGCTDNNTVTYSRRAFDLLHRRYGATKWAKATPYWFK